MASSKDDEFSPSKKRLKLEAEGDEVPRAANDDNDDDDDLITLSPNNLEHLPIEILMHIFTYTDDIGLLNLAINSSRFEKIAKVVFTDRYVDKYFVIDNESERQKEVYEEQFSRFGSGIRAIKAIDIRDIDKDHWMAQLMDKYIGNRLQKLEFRNCTFKFGCDVLANHMNLTDLSILGCDCEDDYLIVLPNYRNLIKLELRFFKYIDIPSLVWIFRHNPQLERLILNPLREFFTLPELMKYVYEHMRHLKEFNAIDYGFVWNRSFPSAECVDKFLDVMGGLERLGFGIEPEILGMCRRLSAICCQNIKHLEIHLDNTIAMNDAHIIEPMVVARSFQNIETLSLDINAGYLDTTPILALIESFPHLRKLHIKQMERNLSDWVFKLLQKGKNLEKLVVSIFDNNRPESDRYDGNNDAQLVDFHLHFNADFHEKFLNTEHKSNIVIEFYDVCDNNYEKYCRITETEIVWKNKLVHWVGYDPYYSNSKVNLLNLAYAEANNEVSTSKPKKRNPFDLILDYLDLNSMYALHECSNQSKQLVDDYVQRHSDQGGKFVISNEFYLNFNGMSQFGPFVKNLDLKFVDNFSKEQIKKMIDTHFGNLTKLCFRTHLGFDPSEFIYSSVQHYIYYGDWPRPPLVCDVVSLAEKSTNLKILEFRTVTYLEYKDDGPLPAFPNLKTFKFKPYDEDQLKFAMELFAKNGTEILIMDYYSDKN